MDRFAGPFLNQCPKEPTQSGDFCQSACDFWSAGYFRATLLKLRLFSRAVSEPKTILGCDFSHIGLFVRRFLKECSARGHLFERIFSKTERIAQVLAASTPAIVSRNAALPGYPAGTILEPARPS
jgi:hypothetical protein